MSTETTETFAEIGTGTNPFPGLRPFEFDESHLFFGRDGQSEQLISKLGRTRFLAVVGTSGSGKSSLVRAGLLPALLGGFMPSAGSGWRIAILRPGNDPVGNLARALNDPQVFGSEIEENAAVQIAIAEATLRRGSLGLVDAVRQAAMPENEHLLVVVDQFEEIFRFARLAQDEAYNNAAAAFVKLVLEASRQREVPIYVVLTMRSDYLGDCSHFWGLPEAINESQYLIPRLTRDQLREAITGPVAVGGGDITPRLVNRLLNDVGDNQDQLPILQHALMRAWDEWRNKRPEHRAEHEGEAIDVCCYRAIGEMDKALSEHANEAYKDVGREMGERGQKITENIFKCLTEKGADSREIRRPLTLGEICAVAGATEEQVSAVIETFRAPGRSFLMPPAGTPLAADSLIDISHESLIRNWKRLSQWVAEEARLARIYLRLAETAALNAENREGLLRDPALQIALDWREQNSPNEAWARRYHPGFDQASNFLERSLAAREAERLEKENQRRKELRRTRLFAAVLAVAAMFSLGLAAYAMQQKVKAQKSATEAQEQKRSAEESESKAKDLAEAFRRSEEDARRQKDDAEGLKVRALASAAEAQRQKGIALQNEARAKRQEQLALINAAEAKRQSGISAETFGQFLGLQADRVKRDKDDVDLSALLAVESLGARESLRTPNEFGDEALRSALSFLPRGVSRAKLEGGAALSAFTQDGKYLAALGNDHLVRVWDIATSQLKNQPLKLGYEISGMVLSPEGKYLATSDQNDVRIWRADTGQLVAQAINPEGAVAGITKPMPALVAFTPDGTRLATAKGDTVQMWDADTGNPVGLPMKHADRVNDLSFSPDGRYLATGCGYIVNTRGAPKHETHNATYIWDTTTWLAVTTLDEPDPVTAVAISSDLAYLATASLDDDVRVRNPAKPEGGLSIPKSGNVTDLILSRDGKQLTAAGRTASVHIWTIDSLTEGGIREAARLSHEGAVNAAAFSADGKQISTIGSDGVVRVWETTNHHAVARIAGLSGFRNIALSAEGDRLATASEGGVQVWDRATGTEIDLELEGLSTAPLSMTAVALSRNGKYLAAGGEISGIWDLGTRRLIARLQPDVVTRAAAISTDGKYVASMSDGGDVNLFNTRTRKIALRLKAPEAKVIAIGDNAEYFATADGNRVVIKKLSEDPENPVDDSERAAEIRTDGDVVALFFSFGARQLVTASTKAVQVWSSATGAPVGRKIVHPDRINAIAVNRDASRLAIGSDDQTAAIWDMRRGQLVGPPLKHDGSVDALSFSATGRFLATASGKTARIWAVGTNDPVGPPITLKKRIVALALPNEKEILATIDEGKTVQRWIPGNGHLLSETPIKLAQGTKIAFFSIDGRLLIAGNRELSTWNVASGSRSGVLADDAKKIRSLVFSPEGTHLAVIDGSNIARVWDVNAGQDPIEFKHEGEILGVTFDRGGKYLVTCGSEQDKEVKKDKNSKQDSEKEKKLGVVTIWDIASRRLSDRFEYSTGVRAVAVSQNGKYLAAASDQAVRVWTIDTAEKLGEDLVPGGAVSTIAFSPDGKLATGGEPIQIWDPANRRRLARLPAAGRAAFTPDGKYLVTAGDDSAQVWLWRPEELIDEACARLDRNLTDQEWRTYMGNRDYSKTCEKLPVHRSYVDVGIALAHDGDLKGAEAVFNRIKEVHHDLKVEPKAEAQWQVDASRAQETLLEISRLLPESLDDGPAPLKAIIEMYHQIEDVFRRPHTFDAEIEDVDTINQVCWIGSINGYPGAVMSACERAVALEPANESYRDSRGLARALTGNRKGAIEDFEYYLEHGDKEDVKAQRRRWIEALRAGKNPLTPEELKTLR